MSKKYFIAVIGAGEGGFPILRRAKDLEYASTIAFGNADSLARDLADVFVEADVFNIDYIVSTCRRYNVDGVIATSESTTEVTAIIAHQLGLPGNDISNGFGARNKYLMRCRVSALESIRQPLYFLHERGNRYSYPVVVKAPDSCGKRGISIVYEEAELEKAIVYAQSYSSTGAVLVEEYLEGGKEYSIECLISEGKSFIVQYTEKETSGPPHFVEVAHHQPALLSNELRERIKVATEDVLGVLGIRCGMAHLEIKVIEDNIYFIEVGARGGGDHIADILTLKSTDCDYFKCAIDCCLGIYQHQEIHNVAYSGIYFHCIENSYLQPLFAQANSASWCVVNNVANEEFTEAASNVDTSNSGYIIYSSDHKITNKDI